MFKFKKSNTNYKNITNGNAVEERTTASTEVVIDMKNPFEFFSQLVGLF